MAGHCLGPLQVNRQRKVHLELKHPPGVWWKNKCRFMSPAVNVHAVVEIDGSRDLSIEGCHPLGLQAFTRIERLHLLAVEPE